ncbi:glycosyltransferase involved in cell wall biosynthesis [Kerstersia gyiorum]|nr:glycosyltransferase [Kerstersia gyiorum]MCP1632355.1 glycosyltransferase involved in cell wall biosynthesis [Kerstersia gyiorum]MCP1635138.1 glycosyltransferase involved in cell wall biosynthesis [Kerstersia gyiorum]MCP1669935.1 glycosyltransferase involved in cell wall biosynthesis [Kerstersia gyiorum]MCP1678075.1 glycosyltransferase involved in cell wall biosynthesis [Kerstersia gyiorum]MCP1680923.1 glycosyltransferase involved in cell wall biosynthesis [Kerstersia gyiorum]
MSERSEGATVHGAAADGKLRVTHIIGGLGQGGAEAVLLRLVAASASRCQHTVISLSDEGVYGAPLREAGAEVIALGASRGGGMWRAFRQLRQLLRNLRPDAVQTWMYHGNVIGGLAARSVGLNNVAWGIRNAGVSLEKSSRLARLTFRLGAWCSGWLPRLIVCCAQDARVRHEQAGYVAEKLVTVPNGYDLARFTRDPAGRERLRREWKVDADTWLFGCVARWDPLKDHTNLLEAFARLRRDHPEAPLRCVLVGRDMDAANTALASLLQRLQLTDSVILAGPSQDIPAVMSALDTHVLSSLAEGFPNVVAEAMACGTLVVATDVGDAADIVGDAGWIVPARDADALAQGMAQAWQTDGEGRAERGRASVTARFGLERMAQRYEAIWEGLRARLGLSALRRQAQGQPVPARRPRRLMYVVNNPAFFLSHRLPLAQAALANGDEVHLATMPGTSVSEVLSHGLVHHSLPMTRSGGNPLQELRTLWSLWRLFLRVRPDVVHLVTIKPVLYGGIAARFAGVPGVVAAISGLGFLFTGQASQRSWMRRVALQLYRWALGHRNSRVIFQNEEDRDALLRAGAVRPEQVVMIRGSGVDLDRYPALPEPPAPVRVVMAARLLRDKGVEEYVAAARQSKAAGGTVQWLLAGQPDPGNPASATETDVAAWRAEGAVEVLGERHDIAALYASAHIVALPSYREGLPKSLVEAAACGRAVVTTDVAGCRDAITPGVTGVLVPVRDAGALMQAVQALAADDARRQEMGRQGRLLAQAEFDIRKVIQAHLAIYDAVSPRRLVTPAA